MPRSVFSRGQTQILYRYMPGAIFEHQDYGLCRVTSVTLEPREDINRSALFEALRATLRHWDREEFREDFPDPRDQHQQRLYEIGEPIEVFFEPYPKAFICRRCKHVVHLRDLQRRSGLTPGKCPIPDCNGTLARIRYVQAHNCGRLEELFIPRQGGCPQHGLRYLAFDDPGRVAQARWYCNRCRAEIQALRMTPCNCPVSALAGENRAQKSLRVYPTGEPALYLSHVIPFINFSSTIENALAAAPDSMPLLLARVWGVLNKPVTTILQGRRASIDGVNVNSEQDLVERLMDQLRQHDPNNPLLQELSHDKVKPEDEAIIRMTELLGDGANQIVPARRIVEHVALLESGDLTSPDDVVRQMEHRQDMDHAREFQDGMTIARNGLGLREAYVVNNFPIAVTALGYSRGTRDPARSMIRAFPGRDKIPLYVVPTETEGLWFQLDPVAVATWLDRNQFLRGYRPENTAGAWAWLHNHGAVTFEFDRMDERAYTPSELTQMLVHTISHVLLQRIEWSGFAASSIGEYLMPETLSFVLYANRYAESKIGGLTTLFEQRLPFWLADAGQAGRHCVYDPLCFDDGGSCAGCLHREHNCTLFNRYLSRALLFSGPMPPAEDGSILHVRHGFWENVDDVANRIL